MRTRVSSPKWGRASWTDRFAVRHIAPLVIRDMFRLLVHPGVYETVGLPGWATWRAANRSPERVALRYEATRPVLEAMLQAEVVPPGYGRYFGPGTGGFITHDDVPTDPQCAALAKQHPVDATPTGPQRRPRTNRHPITANSMSAHRKRRSALPIEMWIQAYVR